MEEFYPVLEKCPLFAGVRREEMAAMLGCVVARMVSVGKNQTIFAEGSAAKYVGIVLTGSACILREDLDGNRSIMGIVHPGELFGESFACAGVDTLPVSVIAAEQMHILLMDCRRITTSCSSACAFHSRMIFNLLQIVARKTLAVNQKLDIISKRTTREKLLRYLHQEAKRQGSRSFRIPYDRQALADYLAVERSAMSAEIGKLRREGILLSDKNHFTLL